MSRQGAGRDRAAVVVGIAAAISLGLSAGAMLTEAVLYVDYWRSLSPTDFLAWFAANEPQLTAFFAPLQTGSAVLAATAAALAPRRTGRAFFLIATGLAVAALLLYPLYFREVNASFAEATIAVDRVPEALERWSRWQWLRTGVGVTAFAAALLAVRRGGGAT